MDGWTIATICGAFFVAGGIKGVIGIGLPTTAVAILVTAFDLRTAIPLLVVPTLILNVWQVAQGGAFKALFRRFLLFNLCACAGIWLGTRVLFAVDPALLAAILGGVICAYVALNLATVPVRIPNRLEPLLSPPTGLVAGGLCGATGSLAAPMIFYFQALGLRKDQFVQAVGMSLMIATAAWLAALLGQGALSRTTALISLGALAPAVVGMSAGIWLRGRIPEDRFRTIVFLFLLLLGLNLIRKALT